MIFGVCGALRTAEVKNMKMKGVQDIGSSRVLVSVTDTKNDYAGDFLIGNLFYDKVKNYMSLRPNVLGNQ